MSALTFFRSRCSCAHHGANEPGSVRCRVDHTQLSADIDALRATLIRCKQLRSDALADDDSCLAQTTPETLYAALEAQTRKYLAEEVEREQRSVPMTERGDESELAALRQLAYLYDIYDGERIAA